MRDTIDDQHETSMGDDVGAPLCGPGPSLLLTAREVAEILGISRSTVYELLYARRFPSVRIGSPVAFDEAISRRSSATSWRCRSQSTRQWWVVG